MARTGARSGPSRRLLAATFVVAAIGLLVAGWVVAQALQATSSSAAVAWSRLGTRDVHSLRFSDPGPDRLLFGHHDGLLQTDDGGRTWEPLAFAQDAMGMAPASDGSIVIAGHLVLQESRDGGLSWAAIRSDLPSLDIHGFARSLEDPARMWAYLAEGGLYESTDGGARWARVFDGHILQPTAALEGGSDVLFGIDPFNGLVRSRDGGRDWSALGPPPTAPVLSLAATQDGRTLVLGGSDGLYRSADGGSTWSRVLEVGAVLAAATTEDGATVVAVTEDTRFYRSDDAGLSWPGPPGD